MSIPKTTYIGVINKSQLLIRNTLEELVPIPLDYLFEKKFHHDAMNAYKDGRVNFFHYIPIDKEGKRTTIRFNNFTLIDISPEINHFHKLSHRDMLIRDEKENITRIVKSDTNGDNFILADFLTLVDILTRVPDWGIYEKLQTIPLLERKIENLNKRIEKLQSKES